MWRTPVVDHAIVDALHPLLDGHRGAHVVGALSDGARERLAWSLDGNLSTAERPDAARAPYETVVVLDAQRLGEAQAVVSPGGLLTVVAVNPGYGSLLVEMVEGSRRPGRDAADLDGVCERLETEDWEVGDPVPVPVPLALMPFDPTTVPKTVLAYLYARHPDIETYCFLVPARRAGAQPRRWRPAVRPPAAEFPTLPWKTEAEWREEARLADDVSWGARVDGRARVDPDAIHTLDDPRRVLAALHRDLCRTEEELSHIKSSLTWRAIVRYRTARERLLPPATRRGGVYDRARSAIGRLIARRSG